MEKVKQIEIKNRTYFCNNIIHIEEFGSNLLKDKQKIVQRH